MILVSDETWQNNFQSVWFYFILLHFMDLLPFDFEIYVEKGKHLFNGVVIMLFSKAYCSVNGVKVNARQSKLAVNKKAQRKLNAAYTALT